MSNSDHSYQAYAPTLFAREVPADRLDGVRTRRILAFAVDCIIVGFLILFSIIPVFIFGILTLGLGWLLYPVLGVLVAAIYLGATMGGPRQATLGMDFFSIRIEALDGRRIDALTAIVHSVIFWVAHITLTPLLLIVSLFSSRKQLIQDILLGTVIVRSDR